MLELIVGIVAGGLISWLITHSYHLRNSKSQNDLFDKLSDEVRTIILADKRDNISIPELNKLLREKTIDKTSVGALPFKACPTCGSSSLEFDTAILDVDEDPDGMGGVSQAPIFVKEVSCKTCG